MTSDATLGIAYGRLPGIDRFQLRNSEVVTGRIRQDEITVGQPLHQGAGPETIRAVIGKVRLTYGE